MTDELVPDLSRMRRAIELATDAEAAGDVPVGAVLVCGARAFEAYNEKERRADPTAHAEMIAIRAAASALGTWRLTDGILYVTKEPCAMCAGAIVAARIATVVFGCVDPKGGGAGGSIDLFASSAVNHTVRIIPGVMARETAAQLQRFFEGKRRSPERPRPI